MDWQPLIEVATEAREKAYAPFSSFKVGSAVATEDGTIHPGCNVENRTFGATICAERVAVTSAVARGQQRLTAVAVVTASDPPAPPCGLCLEVLTEFGHPDLPILLVSTQGTRQEGRLSDFLPRPFDFSA